MAVSTIALAVFLAVSANPGSVAGAAPDARKVAAARSPDLAVRAAELGTTRSAVPTTLPRLGGPFAAGELLGAGAGVLAGDLAVIGLTYGTLQLFANGTFAPTAANFRNAAYVLAASAVILPPLGAMLGGALARSGPTRGHPWKAFALSLAGHAASLAVAYLATPHYWAIVPAQLATMTTGTSLGLHWGRGPRHPGALHAEPAGQDPSGGDEEHAARPPAAPRRVAVLQPPMCLDRG